MSDQREIGPELVRRVTHLNDVLEENDRLRAEIASQRLTDKERAAVKWAAAIEPEPNGRWTAKDEKTWNQRAATLRGLLDRLGDE